MAGRGARLPADVSRRREGGWELTDARLLGPAAVSGVDVVLDGVSKTTLLNLIGALDRSDAGSIVVGGEELSRLDAAEYRAATVGFVFQFHNLIPTLSAAENVQIPMIGRGVARRDRERRSRALLEEVGLAERLDSSPTTLSGGECQRVAIARALANEPRLLLADEPTGALDSDTSAEILQLLLRLRDQRRMTVLLVTNDQSVSQQADRVLRLRDGSVEPAAQTDADSV